MATQEFGVRVVALGVGEFRRNIQSATSDMNNFNRSISSASGTANTLGPALSRIGGSITNLGKSITIGVTAPIIALLGVLTNLGADFEEAFAGVTKTVDGLAVGFDEIAQAAQSELGIVVTNMDEAKRAATEMGMAFGDLTPLGESVRQQFRDLGAELPMPISEIAELGEQIGQLGVGADKIAEVTELISFLGVATDLSATDAANGLIRFKNILLGTGGDIEDFVRRAGSALVELGNASVSTEGEILNLSLRLAAAGDRAKMTAPEILAWATTLSDLGVRAESGGTAVSRAITEIIFAIQSGSENIATFASVTGDSVDEFSRKFSEDASSALAEFVSALEAGIRTGRVTKDMLAEMGLSGVRSIDIMGRLGDAMDIFSGNLATANKGWEEQVALQEEAEKRFATIKSQVQLAKNAFTDFGITVFDLVRDDLAALITSIKTVLGGFKKLPVPVQEAIIKFGLMAAAIGPVLVAVGLFISALGTVVTVVTALASPLGIAAIAVGALGASFLANMGDDKAQLIQPIIDKVKELSDILFGMKAPVVQAPSVQFADMPFLEEDQMQLSNVAPTPEEVGMTERFAMVLDNVKATLLDLIPPKTMADLKAFAAGVILTGVLIKDTFLAIIETAKVTLGPELSELFQELTNLLAQFGLDWDDVWNGIKAVLIFVVAGIGTLLLAVVSIVLGLVTGIVEALTTFTAFLAATKAAYDLWVQGVKDTFSGLGQIIQGFFNLMVGLAKLIANVFTGSNEEIKASFDQLYLGITQVVGGILQTLVGLSESVAGIFLVILNSIIGFGGTILSFLMGLFGGILSFIGQMYGQLTGQSDNFITQTVAEWQGFTDRVTTVVSDMVTGITALFQSLFDAIIGHSIIPDLIMAVLAAISGFKSDFLVLIGELVDGAIGKFVELGTKIGSAIGELFGGGEGGGFELDLSALDDARGKIDEFKNALSELPAAATSAATAFVAGFATVLITQTTLLTQTFLLLWQTAILGFTLLLPLITTAWLSMSTILQTLTITMAATISTLWAGMTVSMLTQTTLMISMMIAQHSLLVAAIMTATSLITAVYASMVATSVSLFNQMIAATILVMGANAKLALATAEVIPIATNYVMGLAGAYQALARAAWDAAAAVVGANKKIVEAGGAAYEEMTGSPELKIQHPFERFEQYLKSTDFSFNLGVVDALGGMLGMLNNVLVPQGQAGTSSVTNNTLQVGTINGSRGDEDGANLLFDRWLALKESR